MLVDNAPDIVVAGLSDRLTGLVAQLEGSQPDVLLLDWDLSDRSMAEFLASVKHLEPRPIIIVLSARTTEKDAFIAAGAHYFIPKDAPPDELLPILNLILQEESRRPDYERKADVLSQKPAGTG